MASIASSWRIIEQVLWENAHSLHQSLRRPATDGQISRLAQLAPDKLPRDFVQSPKIHDGLKDSYLGNNRLFDYYALLPVSAIIAVYKMMVALQAECRFPGGPEGGDPEIRNDAHWRAGWIPIMDADGDKLVLDLDPAQGGLVGQVFRWSNAGGFPNQLLAPSFKVWFAGIAEAFGKRRFALDEYGGIWLKSDANQRFIT